uniref:Peptidase S9A N-terminal domain-containing protein n=1 Tax=Acrobeloides nanus TaxID=290746 RepID=A0A914E8J4_9BILA
MKHLEDISIHPKEYPLARREESIIDNYHGTKVADPYRWLEDPHAKETQDFIQKLNDISSPYFQGCEMRETIKEKLTQIFNYEKYGCTGKYGKFYYYNYNSGLQNQSVIYQQTHFSEEGKVFLDPNTFSPDGSISISQRSWSNDGNILAYGLSEKGNDTITIKFIKNTGEKLLDTIYGVKYGNLAWCDDNSGIFYSAYPHSKNKSNKFTVEEDSYHSLYYHKMGTNTEEDILVAYFPDNLKAYITASVTEDGSLLMVSISDGCSSRNALYYYNLKQKNNKIDGKLDLMPIFSKFDACYEYIDHEDNIALFQTNHNAPMFKLIRLDLTSIYNDQNNYELIRLDLTSIYNDQNNYEVIIPEDANRTLSFVVPVANNKLLISYLEVVLTTLYVYDRASFEMLYKIPLEIGSMIVSA